LKIAGGVYLNLHDGMKAQYLHCPWNTSLDDWYKKWFYIREEPNMITLCDVGYILEKKTSWSEKPEHLEQILEIFGMIPWKKTRWSERGRELHQPTDPALPEEGTS
jgi:hypothetical protein